MAQSPIDVGGRDPGLEVADVIDEPLVIRGNLPSSVVEAFRLYERATLEQQALMLRALASRGLA